MARSTESRVNGRNIIAIWLHYARLLPANAIRKGIEFLFIGFGFSFLIQPFYFCFSVASWNTRPNPRTWWHSQSLKCIKNEAGNGNGSFCGNSNAIMLVWWDRFEILTVPIRCRHIKRIPFRMGNMKKLEVIHHATNMMVKWIEGTDAYTQTQLKGSRTKCALNYSLFSCFSVWMLNYLFIRNVILAHRSLNVGRWAVMHEHNT